MARKKKKKTKVAPYAVLIGVVIGVLIYWATGEDVLTSWDPEQPHTTTTEEPDVPPSTLSYLPSQVVGDRLIHHQYYSLSYSSRHQNPEWVAYQLLGQRLEQRRQVERSSFREDPKVPQAPSSEVYTKTGYDRGHMVPAHDMAFSRAAMEESFFMSNVCPQDPDFNRGIWKRLEEQVRNWAATERRLYVIVGPLLRERVPRSARLGNDGPSIPRGFFKVILDYDGSDKKGIAFMFDNKGSDAPLGDYVTSIDRVEAYTGLDFFPNLSPKEEKRLEGYANLDHWR